MLQRKRVVLILVSRLLSSELLLAKSRSSWRTFQLVVYFCSSRNAVLIVLLVDSGRWFAASLSEG